MLKVGDFFEGLSQDFIYNCRRTISVDVRIPYIAWIRAFATIAFGGSVGKVSIFPAAYTECDVLSVRPLGKAVIGLSGMIFPMLFSWLRFKNFYVWYPVFVLRGIIFLSFAISAVSIGLFYNGTIVENEDVVQVIRICSEHTVMAIALVIVMAVLSAVLILTDHPIKQFLDYLLN